MKALVLSGGGALGAFQVGAEKYARDVKKYRWDLIAGISIGAINGAMLAMGKHERLYELWSSEISNQRAYGWLGRFHCTGLFQGFRSVYTLKKMRDLVESELRDGTFHVPLRVGAVSLITGKYEVFKSEEHDKNVMLEAVLASAAVPIFRPPVDVRPESPAMIDGGIRNTSPIGDVLRDLAVLAKQRQKTLDDIEIVMINCLPRDPGLSTWRWWNLVRIGMRQYDLMVNEIFWQDVQEFLLVNALVKQAKEHGVVLEHPELRRPLRYVPYKLIEPASSLGDGGDFSIGRAVWRRDEGWRMAQEVWDQRP
ncbi:MAG: patatin-like phospholipase family protein [Chloroflexi bacterium]|nr:patatin-like phospholipase family protein [Chloroflexota bacterium]